jgi:hypothetical protein
MSGHLSFSLSVSLIYITPSVRFSRSASLFRLTMQVARHLLLVIIFFFLVMGTLLLPMAAGMELSSLHNIVKRRVCAQNGAYCGGSSDGRGCCSAYKVCKLEKPGCKGITANSKLISDVEKVTNHYKLIRNAQL